MEQEVPEIAPEPPVSDAPVPEGKAVEVTVSEPEETEGAYTDEKIPENYIDKYPNSDIIETKDNSPEIPEEIVNDVNKAVDKVAEDFPVIREQVEPVVFADTSPDLGENGLIPGKAINVIRLSEYYCSDYSLLREKLLIDFDSHFSYEADSVGSLACHELGHALHKILAMKRAGIKYGEVLTPLKEEFIRKNLIEITIEIYDKAFKNSSLTTDNAIFVSRCYISDQCNSQGNIKRRKVMLCTAVK